MQAPPGSRLKLFVRKHWLYCEIPASLVVIWIFRYLRIFWSTARLGPADDGSVSLTNQPDSTGSSGSRYGVCTLQAFNLANVRIPLRVSMFFAQHIWPDIRGNLGLDSASSPRDHHIWLLRCDHFGPAMLPGHIRNDVLCLAFQRLRDYATGDPSFMNCSCLNMFSAFRHRSANSCRSWSYND